MPKWEAPAPIPSWTDWSSFNRPAGNLTGVYVLFNELIAKQMEVLHELVPAAGTIAILDNSANPSSDLRWREMQKAGGTLGVKVLSMNVGTERELDSAFDLLRDQQGFFKSTSPV